MKKLLAMVLCFALLIPCALAEPTEGDIFDLFIYAEIFGLPELKLKDADVRKSESASVSYSACWYLDSLRYIATFNADNEVNGAMIDGIGDPFFSACASIITYLDDDYFTTNLGSFLFAYLLVQQKEPGETEMGTFADETPFRLTKQETNYRFIVRKSK